MTYAELAVMQASRAKTFSAAQTDAMAAYCQAEHDLKELQAENAKLRESLEYANNEREKEAMEYLSIQDQNRKLRELVRDMVLNMGGCALHGNPLRLREFGSRAIELGIEVVE